MAISLILVSCGSGSGDAINTETQDSAVEQTTITGKAIDGYISGATVCLDLDDDGICTISTEPFALSKADGSYSLELKASHKTHINYKTASVVVYGGVDTDTSTNFNGKLKAQAYGKTEVYVTPVTTVADGIYDNGKAGISQDEAEHRTATVFGIQKDEVASDPIATNNTKLYAKALAVQKAVDILAAVDDSSIEVSEKAEKIMLAIASGFKSDTVQSDMADIVANIDSSKLNVKSTNAIELARELAKITDEKMNASQDRLADAKFCGGYFDQAHQFARDKGVDTPITENDVKGFNSDEATISGRLYFDETNVGLSGKTMWLLNYPSGGNPKKTTTDADGNYSFLVSPGNAWSIKIPNPGAEHIMKEGRVYDNGAFNIGKVSSNTTEDFRFTAQTPQSINIVYPNDEDMFDTGESVILKTSVSGCEVTGVEFFNNPFGFGGWSSIGSATFVDNKYQLELDTTTSTEYDVKAVATCSDDTEMTSSIVIVYILLPE